MSITRDEVENVVETGERLEPLRRRTRVAQARALEGQPYSNPGPAHREGGTTHVVFRRAVRVRSGSSNEIESLSAVPVEPRFVRFSGSPGPQLAGSAGSPQRAAEGSDGQRREA